MTLQNLLTLAAQAAARPMPRLPRQLLHRQPPSLIPQLRLAKSQRHCRVGGQAPSGHGTDAFWIKLAPPRGGASILEDVHPEKVRMLASGFVMQFYCGGRFVSFFAYLANFPFQG